MTCDDARVLMHALLDDELDLISALEVQRQIERCPECSREFGMFAAICWRLDDEALRLETPHRLKKSISRAIPTRPPSASRSAAYTSIRLSLIRRAALFVVPAALAAMLAFITLPRALNSGKNQDLATEVVASHVRSMMGSHLMDVASTAGHTIQTVV